MKRKKKKSNAGRPNTQFKECVKWLRSTLTARGESSACEINLELRELGYGQSTIDKAKRCLGVTSHNVWTWSLPPSDPPHPDPQLENYS